MQPELYHFGGDGNIPWWVEAGNIVRYVASDPSFVMLAWGNELQTDGMERREQANEWRGYCRSVGWTRSYAEGSNNNCWSVWFNTGVDYHLQNCRTNSRTL
jgi:hypothetical protein